MTNMPPTNVAMSAWSTMLPVPASKYACAGREMVNVKIAENRTKSLIFEFILRGLQSLYFYHFICSKANFAVSFY